MTEKIPNFYFDLIARIVPGGLLIILLMRSAVVESLEKPNLSQAVLVTFVGLVSAYIVGYVLETCAGVGDWIYAEWLHPALKKQMSESVSPDKIASNGPKLLLTRFRNWFRKMVIKLTIFTCENFLPSQELWKFYAARRKEVSKSMDAEHLFDLKEMPERVLFRTLLLILFAASVVELNRVWLFRYPNSPLRAPDFLNVAELPMGETDFYCFTQVVFFLVLTTFLKIWYFASRRVANEPCHCGSGTKHKQCCGK